MQTDHFVDPSAVVSFINNLKDCPCICGVVRCEQLLLKRNAINGHVQDNF